MPVPDERRGVLGRELVLGPIFLMCFDDHPKRTPAQKIEDAMVAYHTRFNRQPTLVLVNNNVALEVAVDGAAIERRGSIPPHHFWVGMQPDPSSAPV